MQNDIAKIVRSEHEDSHLGRCYESPDAQLRYVPICKCGSTTGERWCSDNNWTRKNYLVDPGNQKYIAIIREPWDRWMSAVDMYLRWNLGKTWQETSKDHLEVIAKTIIMDQHSERQALYLHNIESSNLTLLKLDDSLSENWKGITGQHLPLRHWNPKSGETVRGREEKHLNREWFDKLYNNKAWWDRFTKIYKTDFELWNKT